MLEFQHKAHQIRHHPDDWREAGHDVRPRIGQVVTIKGDPDSGELFIPDGPGPVESLFVLLDGSKLLLTAIAHAAGNRLHPSNP